MATTTQPIHRIENRGERLYPPRWSRLYWHLTCLRRAFEKVVSSHLVSSAQSRVVDFGCGNMPYRRLIEPHVAEYIGVDLEGNAMADVVLSAGTIPVNDESVDLVISTQVLEHVLEPAAYLREARRVLKHAGLLILSTHGVWRYHPDPNDYWRWTSEGLKTELRKADFQIVEFIGVMAPSSFAIQLLQDSWVRMIPRSVRPFFFYAAQVLVEWADRLSSSENRQKDACAYVVVAQKT